MKISQDFREFIECANAHDFETAYLNRVAVEFEGVDVPFVGLDDPKKNKAASGRYQDLADLENLD